MTAPTPAPSRRPGPAHKPISRERLAGLEVAPPEDLCAVTAVETDQDAAETAALPNDDLYSRISTPHGLMRKGRHLAVPALDFSSRRLQAPITKVDCMVDIADSRLRKGIFSQWQPIYAEHEIATFPSTRRASRASSDGRNRHQGLDRAGRRSSPTPRHWASSPASAAASRSST